MPWRAEPDNNPPKLVRTVPADGEQNVPITLGWTGFNEFVGLHCLCRIVRLFDQDGNAIEGWGSAQA